MISRYSISSEDFFKLWPVDKSYYWNDEQTAFIAYKVAGTVAFALADPIGPDKATRQKVFEDFVNYWRRQGYIGCCFVIPEASLPLYAVDGIKTIRIGSGAVVDTHTFVRQTTRNKWWRWQLNRGTKLGYCHYSSLPPHGAPLLKSLKEVSDAWLLRQRHQEQGFALGYFDMHYLNQCRVHYLRNKEGTIVAFANEVPIFNALRQGTVDLMRFAPEAQGAMPFLLASIIQQRAAQNTYDYFDLGFAPLAQVDSNLSAIIRLIGRYRFSTAGLEQFKSKFEPEWQPSYIAYDGDLAGLATIAINLESVLKP